MLVAELLKEFDGLLKHRLGAVVIANGKFHVAESGQCSGDTALVAKLLIDVERFAVERARRRVITLQISHLARRDKCMGARLRRRTRSLEPQCIGDPGTSFAEIAARQPEARQNADETQAGLPAVVGSETPLKRRTQVVVLNI